MRNILIADDHPLICKGFRQILSEASSEYAIYEVYSGQEVLDITQEKHFDIILLDITLPDMNGLRVLKELKQKHPLIPVLIVSMHSEEQYAVSAMKSGASGYLTKKSAADELLSAIEKITGGGKWITSTLADKLAYLIEDDDLLPNHDSLTTREYQVLCMIASGKTVKEIAGELFLSNKTIFFYRDRIKKKLDLKGTSDIIRYALRHKIIETE